MVRFRTLTGLWTGGFSVHIGDYNSHPSNITEVMRTVYLPVGELTTIVGALHVGAGAIAVAVLPEQPADISLAVADASHTANYYLTPLLDGVGYTSASGRTYFYSGDATPVPTPALLPGLIGLGLGIWRKRKAETGY
jgi:hypothetical protein